MGWYETIQNYQGVAGVHKFSQGGKFDEMHEDIGKGVCRGIVLQWLRAKKDGTDFWQFESKPQESQGLLDSHHLLQGVISTQSAYVGKLLSGDFDDKGSDEELAKSGLKKNELAGNFSNTAGYYTERASIAQTLLGSDCRFFILSMRGHALGAVRKSSWFGKSSDVAILDPNVGEFACTGENGIKTFLKALKEVIYADKFDAKYALYAYG